MYLLKCNNMQARPMKKIGKCEKFSYKENEYIIIMILASFNIIIHVTALCLHIRVF